MHPTLCTHCVCTHIVEAVRDEELVAPHVADALREAADAVQDELEAFAALREKKIEILEQK